MASLIPMSDEDKHNSAPARLINRKFSLLDAISLMMFWYTVHFAIEEIDGDEFIIFEGSD